MPSIELINVTKTFNEGKVLAVDNISFSIRKGEITGLLGPNGAGKTTTLRMLTCYLKPTSGKICVGDYLTDENQDEIRDIIGYLPESAPLYGDMIVYVPLTIRQSYQLTQLELSSTSE